MLGTRCLRSKKSKVPQFVSIACASPQEDSAECGSFVAASNVRKTARRATAGTRYVTVGHRMASGTLLADDGFIVDRKTVAKRMRLMGIEGISTRTFATVSTIQSEHGSNLPDLVKRLFDAGELNRVWLSDVTYLRTREGWLYLCVIRD